MNQAGLPPELAAIMGIVIAVACGVLILVYAIYIFYLLTLQKALTRCSPRNRLMEPAMVWLFLIPCFNLVWQFFIAIRIPDSLKNEFRDRNRDDGSDYGKNIAMTQAILGIVNIPLSGAGNAFGQQDQSIGLIFSGISMVVSLIGFILFIIFWVKIANYSSMLASDDGDYGRRERNLDDYDDDDDRGGPRGGSSPPPETFKAGDAGRYQ